jgi:hypothetical protein
MKSVAMRVLAVFGLATMVAMAGEMKVDVPFDFHVGDKAMPAGSYVVKEGFVRDSVAILPEHGTMAKGAMVLPYATTERAIPEQPTLVFNKYGDQYFLASVWTPGKAAGQKLQTSRTEKNARQEATATGNIVERIELALAR